MSRQALQIRRATVDDRAALRQISISMRLSADELEKRLTEFQVVETSENTVVGAVGIQFAERHALLHHEGYSDFAVADTARQLFWERIQTLCANHGAFRVWTQERSPFWKSYGFQPPAGEVLVRLPAQWKNEFEGGWLTMQLKNEEAITTAMENRLADFMAAEKLDTARVSRQAQVIKTVIAVVGFAIGIICFALAIYLFMHRLRASQ